MQIITEEEESRLVRIAGSSSTDSFQELECTA